MTRKEEIREAANSLNTGLNSIEHIVNILKGKTALIVGLTEHFTAPESSPAPLESQEKLWMSLNETFGAEWYDASPYQALKALQSKFILTRRTEGDLP